MWTKVDFKKCVYNVDNFVCISVKSTVLSIYDCLKGEIIAPDKYFYQALEWPCNALFVFNYLLYATIFYPWMVLKMLQGCNGKTLKLMFTWIPHRISSASASSSLWHSSHSWHSCWVDGKSWQSKDPLIYRVNLNLLLTQTKSAGPAAKTHGKPFAWWKCKNRIYTTMWCNFSKRPAREGFSYLLLFCQLIC